MVADSFRSEQECCAELALAWKIKDRSSSTPVARPELPFEVGNMDLIGPIDPPSLKGHKYILRLVDQHTRWGEAVPLTSLSAKLPAPGNRSNERRYREKDLATTEEKMSKRERRERGDEKAGVVKSVDTAERCIVVL
ncbi:retrovirus-related Pol polyprotein from transposon opus [Trichonephila clavipes]|nr:retrovirus-related Pol polyprotein from transposon opus [Trichonephila clavipes]